MSDGFERGREGDVVGRAWRGCANTERGRECEAAGQGGNGLARSDLARLQTMRSYGNRSLYTNQTSNSKSKHFPNFTLKK